jgi:hypothetical protein
MTDRVTFAVAVNNRDVLASNLLASPLFAENHRYELLVQEGFDSAAKAYNDAIDKCTNDLIVFCHQDILLPEYWLSQLKHGLEYLNATDPHWGVIGCYGRTTAGTDWGHVYSSGRGILGMPFQYPEPVQTLDEIVLVMRRSTGLRFDEKLPYFHLYGADICLRASERGMRNYAVCAFCIHNTFQSLILPKEFYKCCNYMRNTWSEQLPIRTPTITLTKHNIPVWKRRIKEASLHIRGKVVGGNRIAEPGTLLERFKRIPTECSTDLGLSLVTRVGWHLRKHSQRTNRVRNKVAL